MQASSLLGGGAMDAVPPLGTDVGGAAGGAAVGGQTLTACALAAAAAWALPWAFAMAAASATVGSRWGSGVTMAFAHFQVCQQGGCQPGLAVSCVVAALMVNPATLLATVLSKHVH